MMVSCIFQFTVTITMFDAVVYFLISCKICLYGQKYTALNCVANRSGRAV